MLMAIFAILVLCGMAANFADISIQLAVFLGTMPAMLYMVFCRWSTPKPRNRLFILMTLATVHIAHAGAGAALDGDTLIAIILGLFLLAWSYATLGVASKMTSIQDNRPHILAPRKDQNDENNTD